MRLAAFILLGGLFAGCQSTNESREEPSVAGGSIELKYARGFVVEEFSNYTKLTVTNPYSASSVDIEYYLVPKDATVPASLQGNRVLRTPIERIVCTSTTHLPLLEYLDKGDILKGFPGTEYISSSRFLTAVASGSLTDLGPESSINLELLVALQPELVMGYMLSGDYGQWAKIEELGVPVVINAEYLEPHPLGRAEWIKFMALLLAESQKADSVFQAIEKEYLQAERLAARVELKPTVLSGVVYGDAWFMPGGDNYASRILRDAGATYTWEEDTTSGFLELSFESVYERAHMAEYWIGVSSFSSLEELQNADERYTSFQAFQTGNVYNHNKRMGPGGGNEYLELGYLRPDLILKDLIRTFHPDLLPDHDLFFFQRLE